MNTLPNSINDDTSIVEKLDSGIMLVDNNYRIIYVNPWFIKRSTTFKKIEPDENPNQLFFDLFPDLKGGRIEESLDLALKDNLPSIISHIFLPTPFPLYDANHLGNKSNASEKIFQSITLSPFERKDFPDELFCIINISDISAYVQREQVLKKQIEVRKTAEFALEQEKLLFVAGPCVTFKLKCDGSFTINSVSPNIQSQFGYKSKDLLSGRSYLELICAEDQPAYLEAMESNIQEENYHFALTYRIKNSDGRLCWVNDFIHIIYDLDDEIQFFHGYIVDITAEKSAELEMKQQAYYDALTNLPNRRMLTEKLEREIDRSRRKHFYSALMYLDLDKFKYINDSLGHDVGDSLLVEVANRITETVRKLDMGIRMGGDEFVILLSDLGKDKELAVERASNVSEKVRKSLSTVYVINDNELHTSPSIGVSLFSGFEDDVDTLEDIIQHADTAMYRAKDEGRNTVRFYNEKMQKLATKRIKIEKDLRVAVSKNEMRLLFQPQISFSRDLIACEALVRWEKDHKIVSPVDFIPIAEETGVIIGIGEWVLHEACRNFKSWQKNQINDTGYKMDHIAVNVSPRQFRDENFIELVSHVLNEFSMQPGELEIEITEGIVIDNVEETIEKMNKLKSLGIRLAMDDFGTGYSSLSYLKKLPLDILKIDQAFIRDASFSSDDKAIVSTIIAMAKKLGMTTVAEGIENDEILSYLESEGCSVYQGYYFSKPISSKEFSIFLQNWK